MTKEELGSKTEDDEYAMYEDVELRDLGSMEYAVNIQAVYEKYNPKKLQDAGEKSDVADVGQLFRFVVFLFLSTACANLGFRIWPMLLCWAGLLLVPFWTPFRQQPGKPQIGAT